MALSDILPLDRNPSDFRHPNCSVLQYDEQLPSVSIIIVFYNEGLTVLQRTINSIMTQSPPELILEVLLIDDGSDIVNLQDRLEDYIELWDGIVKKKFTIQNRQGQFWSKINFLVFL